MTTSISEAGTTLVPFKEGFLKPCVKWIELVSIR